MGTPEILVQDESGPEKLNISENHPCKTRRTPEKAAVYITSVSMPIVMKLCEQFSTASMFEYSGMRGKFTRKKQFLLS